MDLLTAFAKDVGRKSDFSGRVQLSQDGVVDYADELAIDLDPQLTHPDRPPISNRYIVRVPGKLGFESDASAGPIRVEGWDDTWEFSVIHPGSIRYNPEHQESRFVAERLTRVGDPEE